MIRMDKILISSSSLLRSLDVVSDRLAAGSPALCSNRTWFHISIKIEFFGGTTCKPCRTGRFEYPLLTRYEPLTAHTTPFAQHRCKTTSYDCILAFILGFSYTPVLGEAQNFSILKSHYHTTIAVNSQAPGNRGRWYRLGPQYSAVLKIQSNNF